MLLVPDYGGRKKPPWLGFGAEIQGNTLICQVVATEIEIDFEPFDALLYVSELDESPKPVCLILKELSNLPPDIYDGIEFEVVEYD